MYGDRVGGYPGDLRGYPFVLCEYDHSRLDTDKNVEAALDWARDIGVLGITPATLPRRGGELSRTGGDAQGGSHDTVWRFVVE
jgi:hypothetical protein